MDSSQQPQAQGLGANIGGGTMVTSSPLARDAKRGDVVTRYGRSWFVVRVHEGVASLAAFHCRGTEQIKPVCYLPVRAR